MSRLVLPHVIAVYYYFFIFLDCNQKSSVSTATHFYNICIRPVVIFSGLIFFQCENIPI